MERFAHKKAEYLYPKLKLIEARILYQKERYRRMFFLSFPSLIK